MTSMIRAITVFFCFFAVLGISRAEDPVTLRVCTWNLEGNGKASTNLLKQQIADKDGIDLWGLCEVKKGLFDTLRKSAEVGEGSAFKVIKGSTGGPKLRMAIIYDTSVLEPVGGKIELTAIQISSGLRAPLVQKFKGKRTGQEFFFMVNHLKCCSNGLNKRKQQCKLINKWVEEKAGSIPVIMCGDLNDGTNVFTGEIGDGIDVLINDGPFTWLEPDHLKKTQASDHFNTVLDYIMVANVDDIFEKWSFDSRILKRAADSPVGENGPNDFDHDDFSTDHRPVDVILTLNSQHSNVDDDDDVGEETDDELSGRLSEILQRLAELEQAIDAIREAINE